MMIEDKFTVNGGHNMLIINLMNHYELYATDENIEGMQRYLRSMHNQVYPHCTQTQITLWDKIDQDLEKIRYELKTKYKKSTPEGDTIINYTVQDQIFEALNQALRNLLIIMRENKLLFRTPKDPASAMIAEFS